MLIKSILREIFDYLTLESGIDGSSQNIRKQLTTYAV